MRNYHTDIFEFDFNLDLETFLFIFRDELQSKNLTDEQVATWIEEKSEKIRDNLNHACYEVIADMLDEA